MPKGIKKNKEGVEKPKRVVAIPAKCEWCGKKQPEREGIFCDSFCKEQFISHK